MDVLVLRPKPVEATPVPPVGGLTYAWGLMLRDLALLLVNRLTDQKKRIYFLLNVRAPPEAFFSPKCTEYRLAAGLRLDPLGELTALLRPLDGFKGRTSKGREGTMRK